MSVPCYRWFKKPPCRPHQKEFSGLWVRICLQCSVGPSCPLQWFLPLFPASTPFLGAAQPASHASYHSGILKEVGVKWGQESCLPKGEKTERKISDLGGRGRECTPGKKSSQDSDTPGVPVPLSPLPETPPLDWWHYAPYLCSHWVYFLPQHPGLTQPCPKHPWAQLPPNTALWPHLHLPTGTSIPLHRWPSLFLASLNCPSLLPQEAPNPRSHSLVLSILPEAPSRQKL